MYNFEYVPPAEWKPVQHQLIKLIHKLQDEVREFFTFQFQFVGSSKRNMITRNANSNIGYDFDVNIEVNDPEENFSPEEIRRILRQKLDNITNPNGNRSSSGYDYTEDSTRVLTIKVKDLDNSKILHSCDFCIVYDCQDGRQQYIRYNKMQGSYSWEYQQKGTYDLPYKIDWIKQKGLWQAVRELYLIKKNKNQNINKHSRTIFAETINEIYQKCQ